MQIFTTGSPLETAKALDKKRLNKQIIEARQVVLQGDTLLVVSANYWSETYILSNGVEVALEIVIDNQL